MTGVLATDDLAAHAPTSGAWRAAGVLERGESAVLLTALNRVEEDAERGDLRVPAGDEDIHTAVNAG